MTSGTCNLHMSPQQNHYLLRACRRCLDEIERGRGIPARVRLVAALEVELNACHTAAGRVLTHPRYSA
jgi:hypothetical protein